MHLDDRVIAERYMLTVEHPHIETSQSFLFTEEVFSALDHQVRAPARRRGSWRASECGLGITEAEGDNKNNSSSDESCSVRFDEVRHDHQTGSLDRDWNSYQIQLDVSRLEHGMYKLDLLCTQQPGAFVQLTQAFEAFVIQIVHTNMIAITSKVICSFIVKMSSWNDMEMKEVKVDTKRLLRQFGLQFS
uniref:ACT domain-containing protein n=1 Tax=Physcomitrium patens TaxID=3218 RepID=A0A2K1J7C4_PHYPA|nr:hypothetical protein PHYPA_020532 [Physcomitrium patens]